MSPDDAPDTPAPASGSSTAPESSTADSRMAEDALVRDRREAVREKAQQVHTRQSRLRLARRSGLGLLAVGAVAAVAVTVTWTVSSSGSRPQLSPANATSDGFVVADVVNGAVAVEPVPEADAATDEAAAVEASPAPTPAPTTAAPVDIRVYVDYLSEGAREWQAANSQQLTSWVDDGAVTLTYHPVAMLTAKSNGTKYSLRAAGAAACVATYSPDSFFAFNNELLVRQPEIDTDGLTDEELATMAQATGADATKTVRECITEGSYAAWAKAATERAVASIPDTDDLSLTRTPMILVNGTPYIGDLTDPAEFSQFVLTSSSEAYYKSAPTPTPTVAPAP